MKISIQHIYSISPEINKVFLRNFENLSSLAGGCCGWAATDDANTLDGTEVAFGDGGVGGRCCTGAFLFGSGEEGLLDDVRERRPWALASSVLQGVVSSW